MINVDEMAELMLTVENESIALFRKRFPNATPGEINQARDIVRVEAEEQLLQLQRKIRPQPLTEPLHVAEINSHRLRFFKSPRDRPDLPWHVPADLATCFALEEGLANAILRDMKTNSRWKDDIRTVATAEGFTMIASHSMAQGFLGAMEEVGQIAKGAFEIYVRAGMPAMDKLDLPPWGSKEFWQWMKIAANRGEPDDRSIALSPGLALLDAAEKYGEVVERNGEQKVRIRMPE